MCGEDPVAIFGKVPKAMHSVSVCLENCTAMCEEEDILYGGRSCSNVWGKDPVAICGEDHLTMCGENCEAVYGEDHVAICKKDPVAMHPVSVCCENCVAMCEEEDIL